MDSNFFKTIVVTGASGGMGAGGGSGARPAPTIGITGGSGSPKSMSVADKACSIAADGTGAGGTGLGLAICKEIIEQHGGRIWAENAAAGGAVFSILLPVEQQQAQG